MPRPPSTPVCYSYLLAVSARGEIRREFSSSSLNLELKARNWVSGKSLIIKGPSSDKNETRDNDELQCLQKLCCNFQIPTIWSWGPLGGIEGATTVQVLKWRLWTRIIDLIWYNTGEIIVSKKNKSSLCVQRTLLELLFIPLVGGGSWVGSGRYKYKLCGPCALITGHDFFNPLPRKTVSQTLRSHTLLEHPSGFLFRRPKEHE